MLHTEIQGIVLDNYLQLVVLMYCIPGWSLLLNVKWCVSIKYFAISLVDLLNHGRMQCDKINRFNLNCGCMLHASEAGRPRPAEPGFLMPYVDDDTFDIRAGTALLSSYHLSYVAPVYFVQLTVRFQEVVLENSVSPPPTYEAYRAKLISFVKSFFFRFQWSTY